MSGGGGRGAGEGVKVIRYLDNPGYLLSESKIIQ